MIPIHFAVLLVLGLLSTAPLAWAETYDEQLVTLETWRELAPLTPGATTESAFENLLTASVSVPGGSEAKLQVEAYVEMHSNEPTTARCRLIPKSLLGRPLDPSQRTLEFMIDHLRTLGANPPRISGAVSVTRRLQAKIPAGVGGAFYSLACRREDHQPVKIAYASLHLAAMSPTGTGPTAAAPRLSIQGRPPRQ